MLKIEDPSAKLTSPHPILNLGFRIFFSGGAVFAAISMLLWIFVFTGKTQINAQLINPFYWHAHEMLFGYAMAIIAGFLLTAVKTWTGIMMPYGYKLFRIFLAWFVARMCWVLVGLGIGQAKLIFSVAMIADLIFMTLSAWAVIKAVMAVKQYKQMGIISKLVLLTVSNLMCYWSVYSGDINYMRIGIYFGLYLVLGIVLTIGRRVVPFFIEKGLSVGTSKKINVKNNKVLDLLSLFSFFIFMLLDIFYQNPYLITLSALTVGVVNLVRLMGWYHHDIWQKPLLWSLFLAFLGMSSSFFMFALQPWLNFSHSIGVHALSISGIGMMTVAMIARVSLGHTGRSIHQPPKTVNYIFILMAIVFVFRVIMPLIAIEQYIIWIMIAQTAWILCFIILCISYLPILAKPRKDGLFG